MTSENQDSPCGQQQAAVESLEAEAQIHNASTELELPPPNTHCETNTRKEKKHWLDYVTFGLELLGLVVLCVYAGYTIKIYSANRDAADAATRANTLAQQGIDQSLATARADQRAWMGMGNISGNPNVAKLWTIAVVFHNSGKTPAKNLFGFTMGDPVIGGGQPDFSYSKAQPFHGGMIPPSGDYTSTLILSRNRTSLIAEPLNQQTFDRLKDKSVRVYVHGYEDYDDIYGCRHRMIFCYFYEPDTSAFAACTEHNDTQDYECKK